MGNCHRDANPSMRNAHITASGLTLIEVLVALLVLSMGAFSLLATGNQALRLGRDAMSEAHVWAVAADAKALERAFIRSHPERAAGQLHNHIIECLERECSLDELRILLGPEA